MLRFSVSYRKTKYFVDIQGSKTVSDLKELLHGLTGIKPERFSLKAKETILDDAAKVVQYKKDVNNVEMFNVVITVRVILGGRSHTYSIGELRITDDFILDILRLSGHVGSIYLHCNGVGLVGSNSLLTNGIEHNAYLTALDGELLKEIEQEVSIQYRSANYTYSTNISKLVTHLKDVASGYTGISVDKFSLSLDQSPVADSKPISRYVTMGRHFVMTDVIITVSVTLNRRQYILEVEENRKIEDFTEDVITKTEYNGDLCLFFKQIRLNGTDTVLTSGLENNACVKAMREVTASEDGLNGDTRLITVDYRNYSYAININPAQTIAQLKETLFSITNIKPEHFCLKFGILLVKDNKEIGKYIGTEHEGEDNDFLMCNVTIKVLVTFNGRLYHFSVKEETKISDFKKEIIRRTGCTSDLNLMCNNQALLDNETLVTSEVEHNASIVALSRMVGG